jgi:septal ring factor EnvC (AmiA/AmiB activator)
LGGEAGTARPTLYGELRLRGQAVDPAPWLAGRGG